MVTEIGDWDYRSWDYGDGYYEDTDCGSEYYGFEVMVAGGRLTQIIMTEVM